MALAAVLLAAAVAPASVGVAAADGGVEVAIEQDGDGGAATVSVTRDGGAVEGAPVAVSADRDYAGVGNYTTGENGTVGLPAPNESVNVTAAAAVGGETAETTVRLDPAGTETEPTPFGLRVSAFVVSLLGSDGAADDEGGIGERVSAFARENNPSSERASGRAGPPSDGAEGTDAVDDRRGPPPWAGPPTDRSPTPDGTADAGSDEKGEDDENDGGDDGTDGDDERGVDVQIEVGLGPVVGGAAIR
ncbi:hypothetical protein [Halegenticoccus soli]|uniref:hypothetical protein n=1 Tax=Halegenticoccus soli TaxID=1985678 RepID=UPI0018EB8B90|nr:hypothetical protein [Halegenticoccus soli]